MWRPERLVVEGRDDVAGLEFQLRSGGVRGGGPGDPDPERTVVVADRLVIDAEVLGEGLLPRLGGLVTTAVPRTPAPARLRPLRGPHLSALGDEQED